MPRTRSRRASRSRNSSATCGWCATIRTLFVMMLTRIIAAILTLLITWQMLTKKNAIIHGLHAQLKENGIASKGDVEASDD